MERGRPFSVIWSIEFPRILAAWQGRVWPFTFVIFLLIALIPYFRVAFVTSRHGLSPSIGVPLAIFPIIGAFAVGVFSLLRPVRALAAFFAVAPVVNALVAWVTIGNPVLYKKAGLLGVELLFLRAAPERHPRVPR